VPLDAAANDTRLLHWRVGVQRGVQEDMLDGVVGPAPGERPDRRRVERQRGGQRLLVGAKEVDLIWIFFNI
jgi:hypothetical protein